MEKIKEVDSKKWNKSDVYDVITMLLIGASVLFAVWRFWPVAMRLVQAIKDVGLSIAYYFTKFWGFGGIVTPSVSVIPDNIEAILPFEWEEMKAKIQTFFTLLVDKQNLTEFFQAVGEKLAAFLENFMMILPFLILAIVALYLYYNKENQDYDKKGKCRRAFEFVEEKAYKPVKAFIVGYIKYIRERIMPQRLLKWIWVYNLNFCTIVLELFAYYFVFSVDGINIHTLYAVVVKLVCDLSVVALFFPWWVWVIIGYKCFDRWRKKIAVGMLHFYEACNRLFLETYLGALFLVGKQRAKKTTIITDMSLTQEVIFREEAYKRLRIRDKQFPFFPWQNLELFYWQTLENHSLPTLASYREFLKRLRVYFEHERCGFYDKKPKLRIKAYRKLKSIYGYTWDNFLFGYDYEKCPLTYNDHLTVIHIFEAIEAYIQLFYIYAAPTSLIFGNYSIRTDLEWIDNGNFPDLCADFYAKDAEMLEEISQYSKVAHLDCFRLGNVFNPDDPYIDGFEVGILTLMEVAKERGNQNTNQGVKTTDSAVNAKNDGFEMNIKMQGHGSTIDNYTFFRFFIDDQRPDSLSADNRDLCNIIMIKEVSDAKLVMPGYFLEERLYNFVAKIYDSVYAKLRVLRGDANNTLLVYLMKKLYDPLFKHHDRIMKEYAVQVASLRVDDAMQDKTVTDKAKYYICPKKVYSDRFATDGIKQFYHAKAKRSKYGLNDFPAFSGKHITVQEMDEMGSLFYGKIIKAFHMKQMQQQMIQAARAKNVRKRGKNRQSVAQ